MNLEDQTAPEKSVVSMEMAITTVNSWLEHKKIKPKKKESLTAFIDKIVEAVCLGQLALTEDFKWKMKLDFPVGDVSELTFIPRINDARLEPYKRGIKGLSDWDTAQKAMLCGLTAQPIGIINNLDSTDKDLAEAISIFFSIIAEDKRRELCRLDRGMGKILCRNFWIYPPLLQTSISR